MKAYGPVPSRRLGFSMGINNIPPKTCSYSCIYCQLGITTNLQVARQPFYEAAEVVQETEQKVMQANCRGKKIDYLTFVPDGEPTLDISLGREISLLKPLGISVAVISNASLMWRADVREELRQADWVSLKVDAVSESIWRRIDRPHKSLKLADILEGIQEFSHSFHGRLVTETMLLQGLNGECGEIQKIAGFLAELRPEIAYLSVPTRPPALRTAIPASEQVLNMAFHIFNKQSFKTEFLVSYEGNAFASTAGVEDDLLAITSVHPMREEAVVEFLKQAGGSWQDIKKLLSAGSLIELEYEGKKFYMRNLPGMRR